MFLAILSSTLPMPVSATANSARRRAVARAAVATASTIVSI
jgi:hypothetical protein